MLQALLRLLRRPHRTAHDPFALITTVPPASRRLVIGLGNPGPTYASTRHNVGFLCVDRVAKRLGAAPFVPVPPVHAEVTAAVDVANERLTHEAADAGHPLGLLLARPLTYMNGSGTAVTALLDAVVLDDLSQVLVVYDDMDLPFGSLRLRERGSPSTHNGLRDVTRVLQTDRIPRLRIGIGQAGARDARDYVLSPFGPDEQARADEMLDRAAEAALCWARAGAAVAMNRFNR